MTRIAGIECKKVSGIAKGFDDYPGSIDTSNPKSDHAWNIVRLNQEPFLVDSTWATGAGGLP